MSDMPIMPPGPLPDTERQMFDLAGTQGPLAALDGSPPAAPSWFEEALASKPESAFVEVDRARVHYLRWGERSKSGLLLVHGNAAHAHWWDFIAPYLARDYNVAAMDLSGMGDSDWRGGGYALEIFAPAGNAVCEGAGMLAPPGPPGVVARISCGVLSPPTGAVYGVRPP